ncbi:MAG: UDP-3-O-(3-hydroxymyristoyl)glucosamine N-acyltransferase [Phycisphaerales bacterium]|nr:UDP-3-O-(3-hydroxymyristoyl)glucosamine N-acyltransferase [Phycisphaerales bacterium]
MSIRQLAEHVGGIVIGDDAAEVTGCAPIVSAGPSDVTFLANARYAKFLATTRAAAVFVHPDTAGPDNLTRIVCKDPYFAFRNAVVELLGFRQHPAPMHAPGSTTISDRATIHPSARVHPDAVIHPGVTVEAHAEVGARTVLYPGVYIGEHAKVGEDSVLYPNVVIYDRCIIGDRVSLHACTVIGQDGFGYATHDGSHHKIPQTGIVVIEDDVETGAGVAIERAALGETRIGAGTKMADLISIGHGTTIGRHCLFVSLVGISGSVEIGNYVVLGGQVGTTGHISIGDGVQAMARTAIASDIEPMRKIGGAPAVDNTIAKKNALAGMSLYELSRRVRQLERQLNRLEPDS